jgi:hypothetical protein
LEHLFILNPPSYFAKAVVHQPQLFEDVQSVVKNLSLLSALLLL